MNQHDESHEQNNTQEVQIQVPPEVQRGVYANQMFIVHTEEEFILDFILASPPTGIVNSRVIISPTHAKRMLAVLQESIANYEARFHEIKQVTPSTPTGTIKH
jgi:hypothetical protein